jgi:hypothetical protein
MEYLDFLDELPPDSTCWQPIFDFGQETFAEAPYNSLESLTAQIKQGFLDYCKQGIMLQVVRRFRLYKAKYKDFTEYCERELGRSAAYCRKIIDAAEVTVALISHGFETLPKCVAQALPLKKFNKTEDLITRDSELSSNWKTIVDSLPENQITAGKIADALDERDPGSRLQKVSIKGETHKILQKKALEAGMSVSKYLEKLITEGEVFEPAEQELTPAEQELAPAEQEAILESVEVYIASQLRSAIADAAGAIPRGNPPNRSGALSDSS